MGDGIFLIQSGRLTEFASQSFETEDVFQDLLASHPDLLAGGQIDAEMPRRWLLVCREMGIPDGQVGGSRWAVDHLFLDQDGVPTLVEVKRSSDTRIRRELVGQMLDYAANAVVYWPVEEIRSLFIRRCEAQGLSPEEVLASLLDGDSDGTTFWDTVKTNLRAGRVRMLFVADVIPPELRRIVEFLNRQMDPAEVMALEIKHYVAGDLRALVPRIIGQTIEAQDKKASSRGRAQVWDEDSFFARVAERCEPAVATAIRKIYDWAKANHGVAWGRGREIASFAVRHLGSGTKLVFLPDNGKPWLAFGNLKKVPPFQESNRRRDWLEQWGPIVEFPPPVADMSWGEFQLKDVPLPEGTQAILDAISWAMDEIDRAAAGA